MKTVSRKWKAKIVKSGYNVSELARMLNVSRKAIYEALDGTYKDQTLKSKIMEILKNEKPQ